MPSTGGMDSRSLARATAMWSPPTTSAVVESNIASAAPTLANSPSPTSSAK